MVAGDRDDVEPLELTSQRIDAECLPTGAIGCVITQIDQQVRLRSVGDRPGHRIHADVVVPIGDDQCRRFALGRGAYVHHLRRDGKLAVERHRVPICLER